MTDSIKGSGFTVIRKCFTKTRMANKMQRERMKTLHFIFIIALACNTSVAQTKILSFDKLKSYTEYFNSIDSEYVVNHVPNAQAYEWLSQNIPLFECPDTVLERTYYYRWWAMRKHLKQTPDGYIFTEFITPVNHAGKHNAVSSALGHHIREGRWLHNRDYIKQYISFWLFVDPVYSRPRLRAFSSWLQEAVYSWYLVNPDTAFLRGLIPALVHDYAEWQKEKKLPNNMYWQYDVRDAMEESISGGRRQKNIRPTINSYMYGNAVALSAMGRVLQTDTLERFSHEAERLKKLVRDSLWDDTARFYKVLLEERKFSDAREAIGYIPWYFNLPPDDKKVATAWDQVLDTRGFDAPWGLTTAERRHPLFRTHGSGHGCEWDGPVWPYATTQTLKGMANLLTNYKHHSKITNEVFYHQLHKYAWSHQKRGKPYLGEYQDEKTGYWMKGDDPRSSYYNHSGFADLIINDLVGIKPATGNTLEIHPLIPKDKWDWFCLDNVLYHGKLITVLWDKTGKKYGKGKGFRVYSDGVEVYQGSSLKPVQCKL